MAQTDHRSPGVSGALAAAALTGAYLLPGLAYHAPPLCRLLGVASRTRGETGVALTFDDGPHPAGTPAVLAVLAQRGVRATFFLVGEQVARDPSLAAEIVAAGHRVGLHCDRHRNLLRLGPRAVHDDIERARGRIEDATGSAIRLYRPPYGVFNAAALAIAHARGWRPLLWTHWGRDWKATATALSIASLLTGPGLGHGSVLLLHDADDYGDSGCWRGTVSALPLVLDELERRGLATTTDL